MNKAFKVAKREYLAQVRTKGFVIGLLVAPIFMSGSGIAFALLEDKVDTRDKRIAVVDYSGLVNEVVLEAAEAYNGSVVYEEDTGRKVRPAHLIEIVDPGDRDPSELNLELSDRIRNDELHGFVVISEGILHQWADGQPDSIAYFAESAALDPVRNWLGNAINNHLRRMRVVEAGIDEETFGDLFDWVNPIALGLPTRGDPVVLDFSIAEMTNGYMNALAAADKPLPGGVAFDPDGRPTTSPKAGMAGAVKAFGGAKGSGIAIVAHVMCTAFVGATTLPEIAVDYGYFMALIKPDLFVSMDEFHDRAGELLAAVKSARPESSTRSVLLPGERSFAAKKRALAQGIEVPDDVIAALQQIAGGK